MERLSVCGWTPPIFPFQKAVKTHRGHKFTLKNCRERTGEDAPPSGTSSAFAILGVQPTCSATELKAAFRAKVFIFILLFIKEQLNMEFNFVYIYMLFNSDFYILIVKKLGEAVSS